MDLVPVAWLDTSSTRNVIAVTALKTNFDTLAQDRLALLQGGS